MLYFVKDNKLHRYPTPKRCDIKRENEKLRDTIPRELEQCIYCMNYWPGDKD